MVQMLHVPQDLPRRSRVLLVPPLLWQLLHLSHIPVCLHPSKRVVFETIEWLESAAHDVLRSRSALPKHSSGLRR